MKFYDKKWVTILFCFVVSFIGLMLCSKNSFLYPFNDWVDLNAFFTVGRGIKHGMIPYLDLFEQKGPIIYFLFYLAVLISESSFIGVFVFEVIALTVFLYYIFKIAKLYLNSWYSYASCSIIALIMLISVFFQTGGSNEEFIMPLMLISFYHLIKQFKDECVMNYKELLLNGFFAGIVLLVKFNILGFWFAFMALTFFYLISKKDYKRAFISCLVFLGGMAIPFIITSIYFICNNSFKVFIDTYFIANMFLYTSDSSMIFKIGQAIWRFLSHLYYNKLCLVFIPLGLYFFTFSKKFSRNIWSRLAVISTLAFLSLGIYIGSASPWYYYLIIMPYALFGLIVLFKIISDHTPKKYTPLIACVLIVISAVFFIYSPNYYYSKYEKDDLVQYKYAAIINKYPNSTLLNYSFLDGGFYMASGKLPVTKFFMKNNIECSKLIDNCKVQEDAIKNGSVDFVVIRNDKYSKIDKTILDKYEIVSTDQDRSFIYELYKKKNI